MRRFLAFLGVWLFAFQAFAVTCTIDPSNIGSNIALSGGNLTWSSTNSGAVSGRGTVGYLAGTGVTNSSYLKYFEMEVNTAGTSALGAEVGLLNNGEVFTNYAGQSSNSISQEASTGDVFYLGGVAATYSTAAATNVVSVATDFFHEKVWWRVNGGNWNGAAIGSQNPATNTGGQNPGFLFNNGGYFTIYPGFGSRQSGPGGTFNLAGPFAYTVPAGYSAWCSTQPPASAGFFHVSPP
jgi:hypothetical protein